MRRLLLTTTLSFLSLTLGFTGANTARAQDRAGAAQAAQAPQAGAPQPPPPGPPQAPPPGGGFNAPAVGNIGMGAMVVPPTPPIGYYAPVRSVDYNLGKFYYYPYYYFPHNYWPTQGKQWPERPGEPYMRPPAYMTYPPFLEPHWRYEWYTPQKYYRGFHFWLDQF
jgi:hypothetical protein